MQRHQPSLLNLCCGLLWLFFGSAALSAQASPEALAAFNAYAARTEARLADQHRSPASFLVLPAAGPASVASHSSGGEPVLERLATPSDFSRGAMLHHWRGTVFVPGASAADFEHLLRDFKSYPQHFAPDVTAATVLQSTPDHTLMRMRVRQHHVITVVLDGTYDVSFSPPDTHRGYSISRSVQIDEIASPGTSREHPLSPTEEHGFLWRQNTYWSFSERDGGLLLQLESLSLTRSIPHGLGWAVGPYVESIPRESLAFTLRSAATALRK